MREVKLALGIPSTDQVLTDWAMCFAGLFQYAAVMALPGAETQDVRVFNKRGSLLPKQREETVWEAKKWGATHLLFIDTDHTFPPQLAHGLMQHMRPVVAINCTTKSIPSWPTARNFNPERVGGDVVYSDETKHGLERVWRVGTGVMLISMEVFNNPKVKGPLFAAHWDERNGNYVGEDWAFCEVLEKAGIPIYVDHDASRLIGHVGTVEYNHSLVVKPEERDALAAVQRWRQSDAQDEVQSA